MQINTYQISQKWASKKLLLTGYFLHSNSFHQLFWTFNNSQFLELSSSFRAKDNLFNSFSTDGMHIALFESVIFIGTSKFECISILSSVSLDHSY